MTQRDILPTLQRVDLICDAFEREWQAGRRPEISPFVAQAAERDRAELTAELVRMDVEYRRKAGESPVAEEYAALFPDRESAATIFVPQARAKPEPESPPATIGPYQLLECLGRGGMGAVYKALHPKLEKLVAIKILRASRLHDAELQSRFQREMKAVGKLDHPHLIRAMDAGEVNDLQYLVMEYVAGADLGAVLKQRGPLPIADACELIRQAAQGMHAAHSLGIVHRDIKPANLILAPSTFGPPVVKVLDLGLALLADSRAEQGLTSASQVMGTIEFMAPEQAGACHKVDHRADIYSLGATLYALLTGRSPLNAPPESSLMQKLTALATMPVPPIRKLRPSVSPELAGVVHKMLAVDPAQRYAAMAEVATALSRFTAGANLEALVTAPSASTTDAAPTLAPRFNSTLTEATTLAAREKPSHRLAVIAAVILALIALGGVYRFSLPPTQEKEVVAPPTVVAAVTPPLSDADAIRRAAEWTQTVSTSKEVSVLTPQGLVYYGAGQPLPPDAVRLDHVYLHGPEVERWRDGLADQIATHLPGVKIPGLALESNGLSTAGLLKMLRLPQFAELQTISVSGAILDDSALTALAQARALKNLTFQGGPAVTGKEVDWPPHLAGLTILNCPSFTAEGVERLSRLPDLYYLNLQGLHCTDAHAGAIAKLRLRNLLLNDTDCNDARAALLAKLPDGLVDLCLIQNPLTDKGLEKFKSFTSLQTLNVTATQVTAAGVAEFQRGVPGCEVTWNGGVAPRVVVKPPPAPPDDIRKGVEWLLSLGPQTSVEVVDTNNVWHGLKPGDSPPANLSKIFRVYLIGPEVERLKDDFPDQFAARLPGTRLQQLSFTGGGLSPAGMTKLLRLPQLSELDSIRISGANVDDSHLVALSSLMTLTGVELNGASLTGEHLDLPPGVTALTLVGCGSYSAQGFERLRRLEHLAYLNVHASRCTAEHAAALAKLRIPKVLLGRIDFDDDRAAQFGGIEGVKDLDLHCNPLTDKGLLEFRGVTSLEVLTVTETQVTAAGVAELQKSLPDCVIEWDGKK